MSRVLGIDLGERRIGLAIAGPGGGRAYPLTTIPRGRALADDVAAVRRILEVNPVDELVVGLPLEARSGDEGDQARRTRVWAEAVATALGLPLSLRDERLTSHLAEQRVGPMKRGRSGGPPTPAQRAAYRARIDREAAAIILQDELDARGRAWGGTA